MESKYTEEDKKFVDLGANDEEKAFRMSIIMAAIQLNGANDAAQPGVAVSYIPEDQYYIRVGIPEMTNKHAEILEQALNWNALGKGKGGLAGAAVRWKLAPYFDLKRESRVVDKPDESHKALIKEYLVYLAANRQTFTVWYSNAWNVMGLAVSCFIRESHHWDANNTRPIKALLGSLNQENEIPDSEYRKLFYLSIHPLPLSLMPIVYHKSLDPLDVDLSATVKTRLCVAPSGYADLCACSIAAESFLHEDFARRCILFEDIVKVLNYAKLLKVNPLAYHPFSSQMGIKHMDIAKAPLTEAMVVLGAYAKSCIGGTLADSPALKKFLEMHSRKVNKLIRGFQAFNERKSDDLIKILTGENSTDMEVISDKIKPLAKLSEKLRGMSNVPEDAIAKAASKIDVRIGELVEHIDKDLVNPVLSLDKLYDPLLITPFNLPAELIRLYNVDDKSLKRVVEATKIARKE